MNKAGVQCAQPPVKLYSDPVLNDINPPLRPLLYTSYLAANSCAVQLMEPASEQHICMASLGQCEAELRIAARAQTHKCHESSVRHA